jgi:hypothetical protein
MPAIKRTKTVKTGRKRTKKVVRYVVVVAADRESQRANGTWSAFVGLDRESVVQTAIAARSSYGNRDYELWVGALTEKVIIPTAFKLVKL